MKKRKYLALLLAAGMIAQTALSTGGVVQVQAAEDTYVKTDELTDNDTAAPKKDSVIPSKNQYEYQKQELAAFCHFGMNTYTGSEWGNGKENPNQFQLTNDFDEETYVKAIHDAGFKKLIITAKHHDGFCIWPSEMTTHDTETAGYEGDVLEELSRACTKYNIDMGLYLSPWDVNSEYYGYKDKDGKKLSITWLTYPTRLEQPKLAEYAQSTLKDIGIEVNVNNTADHATYAKNGDFDVYVTVSYTHLTLPTIA